MEKVFKKQIQNKKLIQQQLEKAVEENREKHLGKAHRAYSFWEGGPKQGGGLMDIHFNIL